MSADNGGATNGGSGDPNKVEAAERSLWNTAYESFFQLARAATASSGSSSEQRFYRTERRVLQQHVEPFYWGTCAGLLIFVTLRVSGSNWFARLRHQILSGQHQSLSLQQNSHGSPSTMAQQPFKQRSSSSSSSSQWKSHLDKETERHAAYAKDLLQLPGDAFVSVLCGMSATLWLSRPTQLCQDVIEAPLLPGKSLVYEHVCPAMEATLQHVVTDDVLQQAATSTSDDNDDDTTLHKFGTLVYNCRQRTRYLEEQQEKSSSAGTEPQRELVGVVPYPGLEGKRRRPVYR